MPTYVRISLIIAFHVDLTSEKSLPIPSLGSTGLVSSPTVRRSPPFSWKGTYLGPLWSGEKVIRAFPDRWIFVVLSLLGLRQWLVRIMPQSLVLAVGAGIGLFIA